MRVADYIAERLHAHGVDHVFGVYGAANGALIDALYAGKPAYVAMQHEQTAGFAAEAYAKVRGLGCAYATSGPGGQNLLTAIANCYYDSTPVIFITGNVSTRYAKPEGSHVRQRGFQECDIVAMASPVCKFAAKAHSAAEIPDLFAKALHNAKSGRPGPVLLDIPQDVQAEQVDTSAKPNLGFLSSILDSARLDDTVTLLKDAKRPAILVGGGCQRDKEMTQRYLLALGAPCFPTWNALDIIPNDFPLYAGRVGTYGGEGFNQAFQECDLFLALGSRISGRITAGDVSTFLPHAQVIVVNNDRATLDDIKDRIGCIGIQADVGTFLLRLNELIAKEPRPDWRLWLRHCFETRAVNDPVRDHFARQETIHPYHALRELSKAVPSNAIIVGDCGGNLVITAQAFKFKNGQKFITSNGNSPMGFSLAGAIGAHYAAPERPIICIIGDGGLSINLQELWTVAQRRLPIKIVLVNNGIYGITDQYQRTNFPDRPIGSRAPHYTAPDFVEIFDAMECSGLELSETYLIEDAVECLLEGSPRPFLLDIKCPGFANYLPRTKGRSISELELP